MPGAELRRRVRQAEAVAGEEQARFVVARVRTGQSMEGGGVVGVGQVRHLVDQHRVEHPLGHRTQAVRHADVARVVRARAPAGRLVGDPTNGRGAGTDEVAVAQRDRARQELVVTETATAGWRVSSRSTSQSIVFWRDSRSRWAGTDTTIRPPTHFASDVFLRRALTRTSTSGPAVDGTRPRGVATPWTTAAPEAPPGQASRRARARTRRGRRRRTGSCTALWPISVTVSCVHAWSASLHRGDAAGLRSCAARALRRRAEREVGHGSLLLASSERRLAIVVIVYIAVDRLDHRRAVARCSSRRAGPAGQAIIPIYNYYVLLKIVGRPGWWLILYFIPIVNIIVGIIVLLRPGEVVRQERRLRGPGFIFLPFIFIPILGLR